MTEELLPCPFCGRKPSTSTYYIECECDMHPIVDWFHNKKDWAITVWNTRTTQSATPPISEPTIPIADMELFVEWCNWNASKLVDCKDWVVMIDKDDETYFDTTLDLYQYWDKNVRNK